MKSGYIYLLTSIKFSEIGSSETSEETSEEDDEDEDDEEDEDEDMMPLPPEEKLQNVGERQPVLLEAKPVHLANSDVTRTSVLSNETELASFDKIQTPRPLPIRQKDEPGMFSPEDPADALLEVLQSSVRETYLEFKRHTAKRKVLALTLEFSKFLSFIPNNWK